MKKRNLSIGIVSALTLLFVLSSITVNAQTTYHRQSKAANIEQRQMNESESIQLKSDFDESKKVLISKQMKQGKMRLEFNAPMVDALSGSSIRAFVEKIQGSNFTGLRGFAIDIKSKVITADFAPNAREEDIQSLFLALAVNSYDWK